jgi:hypothetical protein
MWNKLYLMVKSWISAYLSQIGLTKINSMLFLKPKNWLSPKLCFSFHVAHFGALYLLNQAESGEAS